MESTGARFLFQKRNEKIDWRRLAGVDVDRIAREVDVDAIQENIGPVTYCNIEYELGHDCLDPNFKKLFRLAQLMIEYLLYCQQYLQTNLEEKQNAINVVTEHIRVAQEQEATAKKELNVRNEMYKKLKKELNKAKKQIADYQLMIRAGASGQYKCAFCNKSFVSEFYLNSHLQRRHAAENQKLYPMSPTSLYNSQIPNEINLIRERLLTTEAELIAERQKMKTIQNEESLRNEKLMQDLQKEHALWKNQEQEKMKDEIESFKKLMLEEMKLLQKEKELLQQNIFELEKESGKKKSNLGNLMDEDASDYQILFDKIKTLEENFQIRLDETVKQAKEKEIMQRKKFKKALFAEQLKCELSEKARVEESNFYKNQINTMYEKLNKHEQLLEKSQIPSDPLPLPPETLTNNPIPVLDNSSKEPGDQSNVCLWVSCNSKVNGIHRVSLKPAYKTTDWKDIFSFNAPLTPQGEFKKPVYVYSCGGSPFWRQYISFSEKPPNSSYKHDLTFYVANNHFVGTIKLYVHYAGSAGIVHSMISEKEIVKNWRNKNVSFYTLRNSVSKNSLSNSGFTVSNLSDSDEISVSSIDGTNEVKGSLVVALQKSRENLHEEIESTNNKHQDDSCPDESQDDSDSDENQNDTNDKSAKSNFESNFDLTSSGSILSSMLPEKGSFLPYPHNQLAIARYKPNQQMLDAQRSEIIDILEDNLAKYGVSSDETQMSMSVFNSKMINHAKEIELKERTFPGISKLRQDIRTQLDEFSTKQWMKRKKEKAFKTLTKTAKVVKAILKPGKNLSESSVGIMRPLPSIPASEHSNFKNKDEFLQSKRVHTKNYSVSSSNVSPESELVKHYEKKLSHDDSNTAEQPVNEVLEEIKTEDQTSDDTGSSDGFEVSQSSDWDSDSIQNVRNKKTNENKTDKHATNDVDQTENPYNPKLRPPKGVKVRELAASLEASLTLRDPRKKIAGAVDPLNIQQSKTKRSVSFKQEEDDDSDFSLEETPESNNGAGGIDYLEADDKELEDILSGFKPKPSSSSTPDKKLSKSHTEATIVTDFFDEDNSF